jgi:hypothetical protein
MVFLVLLIPLAVMAFALLMERLERRLHTITMSEQDVEEFLDNARPDEVNTFIREGWTRALSKFRIRSRRSRPSRRGRRPTPTRPSSAAGTGATAVTTTSGATPRSARND